MNPNVSNEVSEYIASLPTVDLLVLERALCDCSGNPDDLLSIENVKELIETYRDKD